MILPKVGTYRRLNSAVDPGTKAVKLAVEDLPCKEDFLAQEEKGCSSSSLRSAKNNMSAESGDKAIAGMSKNKNIYFQTLEFELYIVP